MTRRELSVGVDVAAPVELVWRVATDWDRQGEWILATRVRLTGGDGRSVGSTVEAVTGIGRLGVVDPFEIVEWDPPRRCVVRHTGAVVRGDGVFALGPLGPGRSRFTWTDVVDLPLGGVGRAGWSLAKPLLRAGFARSVRRLGRICEAEHRRSA